nr:hypothetical protein [Paraburkholderia sp. Ac-20347]
MQASTKHNVTFHRVWLIPLILASITAFGLLAALLGRGIWHVAAWFALACPILVTALLGLKRKRG